MINTLLPKIIFGSITLIAIFYSLYFSLLISGLIWGGHTVARYYYLLPKKKIQGQHILLTGGGMGIGKELAIQLAKYGAKISILDLNYEEAKKTQKEINSQGFKEIQIFQCDVSNQKKVKEVFDLSIKTFGEIDILINNAGIVSGLRVSDNNYDLMSKTVEVNTTAHFATILEVFNKMIERDQGHIVTISSSAGFLQHNGLADYNASKYGTIGIHESITLELQSLNSKVKTTCICPWFVKTNMTVDVDPQITLGIQPLKPTVERIVMAILQEEYEVVIPFTLNIVILLKAILPYGLFLAFYENLSKDALQNTFNAIKRRYEQEKQKNK